jgi:site-specific recombinase XerD
MRKKTFMTSNYTGQLATSNDSRMLTADQFHQLAEVPSSQEWFANIINKHTRVASQNDVSEFFTFIGIDKHEDLKLVTRSHVIAWRKLLEAQECKPATIRRKLSALSSLFNYLCERNAVTDNPTHGVKRPKVGQNIGKTPALSLEQVREVRRAPTGDSILAKRDRAILATLYFHGLRRDELCKLKVKDIQSRQGFMYLEIQGKGSKTRYIELRSEARDLIINYLDAAGHREELEAPLFRPTTNNRTKDLSKPLSQNSIYDIVKKYGEISKVSEVVAGFTTHSLRATAATIAIDEGSDLNRVSKWLGHANVSTTQLYDHRDSKPEDSPTFRVKS